MNKKEVVDLAEIIDGKAVAKAVRERVTREVAVLAEQGIVPGLAVILVGEDPASQIYVRNKERAALKTGVNAQTITYPADISQEELLRKIAELNVDDTVDAILVQSPLPDHIDEQLVQEHIAPAKDVDGFHPENVGRLYANRGGYYPVANTPRGVMTLLNEYHVDLAGKNALVIGRSILVGRPMLALLEQSNATVTLAHRYTPAMELRKYLAFADVVVVAAGVPGLVKGADLKAGAVIVDVGINRLDDGTLVGDVDFDSAAAVASQITPVPGGVGPMTIATLLQTTAELAAVHHDFSLETLWQTI
jgi:methylenetetrahydrofolate dehydrogenase (NADP+)/methenyltetrahydrofolate cyclohydrolase